MIWSDILFSLVYQPSQLFRIHLYSYILNFDNRNKQSSQKVLVEDDNLSGESSEVDVRYVDMISRYKRSKKESKHGSQTINSDLTNVGLPYQ